MEDLSENEDYLNDSSNEQSEDEVQFVYRDSYSFEMTKISLLLHEWFPKDVAQLISMHEEQRYCSLCGVKYRLLDFNPHSHMKLLGVTVNGGSGANFTLFFTLQACLFQWILSIHRQDLKDLKYTRYSDDSGSCGRSQCLVCTCRGVQIKLKNIRVFHGATPELLFYIDQTQRETDLGPLSKQLVEWISERCRLDMGNIT